MEMTIRRSEKDFFDQQSQRSNRKKDPSLLDREIFQKVAKIGHITQRYKFWQFSDKVCLCHLPYSWVGDGLGEVMVCEGFFCPVVHQKKRPVCRIHEFIVAPVG